MIDAPKLAVTPSHRVTVAPPRDGTPLRIADGVPADVAPSDVVLEKPQDVSKPSVAAAATPPRTAR